MYRKLTMFLLLFTVIFFLGSCIEKTDKYSKKDKNEPADPVAVQMQALQDSVISYQKQVQVAVVRAEEIAARCDSIVREKDSLLIENNELRVQLAQAREEVIPAMRQQYESIFATQQGIIDNQAEEIKCLKDENLILSNENENLRGDNASLKTQLDNLKPWAGKWQNDAHRSFIKVMFGAGKAPVPDVPTPQLE